MNDLFDNNYFMDSLDAISLIEEFFSSKLPMFKFKDKYYTPGYFSIYYSYENMEVKLGSERGFLEYQVKINSIEKSLLKFEPLLLNAEGGSKKNFLFVMSVIKRFYETTLS